MTKEQFVKRMGLIQNFASEQETLGVMIDKITDGHAVVTIGDYLIREIINIMEEELNCFNMIEWWLYENVEKIIYNTDGTVFADVTEVENLYEYLLS